MIPRLVRRSLGRRPGRSALLLLGYGLGVGVTIALLSIGAALVESSRDRELVGGGDLTVVPADVDLETLRTSGTSSLGLALEQAPFLYRQVLDGPRFSGSVAAAAPWIDDRLVYLDVGGREVAASAGGEIPSRSEALGAAPRLVRGSWSDLPSDRRWTSPGDSALYAEIDGFHLPPAAARGDSTWAEWHYVNVLFPERDAVLYLTFMVAGRVPDGRWGGRILATWQEGSRATSWTADLPARDVSFSTERPDLRIGGAGSVTLDSAGRYRVSVDLPAGAAGGEGGAAAGGDPDAAGLGPLRIRLLLDPGSPSYLPPLDVSSGSFVSGYVAPVLLGRARGRACAGSRCLEARGAPAYHDHNWGVWRDVTWDWGHADMDSLGVLYGGVRGPGGSGGRRFLYLVDRGGFRGLLPIDSLAVSWGRGGADCRPTALRLLARSGRGDSLVLTVRVRSARSTPRGAGGSGPEARFWQILGDARIGGRLHGRALGAAGPGTFETWSVGSPKGTHLDASAPCASGPGGGSRTRETSGAVSNRAATYDGWPLYTYTADTGAGQATGQALKLNGGLWYVLSRAGKVIQKKPWKAAQDGPALPSAPGTHLEGGRPRGRSAASEFCCRRAMTMDVRDVNHARTKKDGDYEEDPRDRYGGPVHVRRGSLWRRRTGRPAGGVRKPAGAGGGSERERGGGPGRRSAGADRRAHRPQLDEGRQERQDGDDGHHRRREPEQQRLELQRLLQR